MAPSREPLGPLELDVLQYISDHYPISVREVAGHFAETSGHARTTVLTVMERLRTKGHLSRRKTDGLQRYSPTVPKSEMLHRMVGTFVDEVLGGAVSPFVAYLTQSKMLSQDEAQKLAQLLKRIESRDKKEKP